MPLFNPFKPRAKSFEELMEGVAQVHKEVAKLPGAQRVGPDLRAQQKLMIPREVVDQYNQHNLFGTTARGEPIRATMVNRFPNANDERTIKSGHLPDDWFVRLDPESKVPADLDEARARGNYPQLSFSKSINTGQGYPMNTAIQREMRRAGTMVPGVRDPRMFDIHAMDVMPMYEGWWSEVPSKGKDLYSLGYDMLRAGGEGSVSETLTNPNLARRLGNVVSHGVGHGDLGFHAPVNEYPGPSGTSFSPQLFASPVRSSRSGAEEAYLQAFFGDNDKLFNQAYSLSPTDLSKFSPDAQLGTLMTREAQMAGVYGPPGGRSMGGMRVGRVNPGDAGAFRNIAQGSVVGGGGSIEGAIGPATMGRQVTTEEAIRGIQGGESPEEVAARLISNAPENGFMNRYARGGLVAAHG